MSTHPVASPEGRANDTSLMARPTRRSVTSTAVAAGAIGEQPAKAGGDGDAGQRAEQGQQDAPCVAVVCVMATGADRTVQWYSKRSAATVVAKSTGAGPTGQGRGSGERSERSLEAAARSRRIEHRRRAAVACV